MYLCCLHVELYRPENISLTNVSPWQLSFGWSAPASHNCFNSNYVINSTSCGVCPRSTNEMSVTCQIENTTLNDQKCSFSVQSDVCGNNSWNTYEHFIVSLKGIHDTK